MLKDRLIFTLLLDGSEYMLSRNFRLQRVGGLEWLRSNYDLDAITHAIDELIVLDVSRGSRGSRDTASFARQVERLSSLCFIPLCAGGGIRTMEHAYRLLDAGADKLVVNTPLREDPALVRNLVRVFGSQCVVASIDYRLNGESTETFVQSGSVATGLTADEVVRDACALGAGEIYLTSIDRDGTGQGYDLRTLAKVSTDSTVPVIASGGAGKDEHLIEGILRGGAQAVATANLFNFIADGLTYARQRMRESGIPLAEWPRSLATA